MDEVVAKGRFRKESKNMVCYELSHEGRLVVGQVYVDKSYLPTPWPQEIDVAVLLPVAT